MASAEIYDSMAGRYTEPFRDAAVRFISLLEDEPWELRGLESAGKGITIEMRLNTESGTWYSLFLIMQSPTLSDDILRAMNDARQSFASELTTRDPQTIGRTTALIAQTRPPIVSHGMLDLPKQS
jgi:hypothetical protein